jgi:hypothetical protein
MSDEKNRLANHSGKLLLFGGLLTMLLGYLAEGKGIEFSIIFYMSSMVCLLFGVRYVVFSALNKRSNEAR